MSRINLKLIVGTLASILVIGVLFLSVPMAGVSQGNTNPNPVSKKNFEERFNSLQQSLKDNRITPQDENKKNVDPQGIEKQTGQ